MYIVCKKVLARFQNLKRMLLINQRQSGSSSPKSAHFRWRRFNKQKAKLQDTVRQWQRCEDCGEKFNDISKLFEYAKEHAQPQQLNTALLCERSFICLLGKLPKKLQKKKASEKPHQRHAYRLEVLYLSFKKIPQVLCYYIATPYQLSNATLQLLYSMLK